MQKGSCTAQSPFIALPLAISSSGKGSTKATGGREMERARPAWGHLSNKQHQSSRKSQDFLQGNINCLSALPRFYVPRSNLKSNFRYRWIIGCEPESERSFSEPVGRVQQNNGALISSLFCGRKKNPDVFPLHSFYFSLTSKASGLFVRPFPHGMSSLRVLQLRGKAALFSNATRRIRDLCKEKKAVYAQKMSKYFSRHGKEEG